MVYSDSAGPVCLWVASRLMRLHLFHRKHIGLGCLLGVEVWLNSPTVYSSRAFFLFSLLSHLSFLNLWNLLGNPPSPHERFSYLYKVLGKQWH